MTLYRTLQVDLDYFLKITWELTGYMYLQASVNPSLIRIAMKILGKNLHFDKSDEKIRSIKSQNIYIVVVSAFFTSEIRLGVVHTVY